MKIIHTHTPQILEPVQKELANLQLILVEINGQKVPMVFDTGASITIINQSTFEIAGPSKEGREITGSGNLGIKSKNKTKIIQELRLGEIIISDLEVLVVDDSVLDFGVDDKGNPLIIDGFFGWDIIQNFAWKVDRSNNQIEVAASLPAENEKNLFWENMPIIPLVMENKTFYFGFDSGNTESMLSGKFDKTSKKIHRENEVIIGLDGRAEIEIEKLDALHLTLCGIDITLTNLTILDRDIFPAETFEIQGLLAADLIENKILRLDYKNNYFSIESL
jgi:hypothetical protein